MAAGVQLAAGIFTDISVFSAEALWRKENEAKKEAAKAIPSSATNPKSQAAPRAGLRKVGGAPADVAIRSNG